MFSQPLIKKAAELIDFENLTNEELTKSKNKEAARIVLSKEREAGKMEEKTEIILENYPDFSIEQLAKLTKLSIDEVKNILKENGRI